MTEKESQGLVPGFQLMNKEEFWAPRSFSFFIFFNFIFCNQKCFIIFKLLYWDRRKSCQFNKKCTCICCQCKLNLPDSGSFFFFFLIMWILMLNSLNTSLVQIEGFTLFRNFSFYFVAFLGDIKLCCHNITWKLK